MINQGDDEELFADKSSCSRLFKYVAVLCSQKIYKTNTKRCNSKWVGLVKEGADEELKEIEELGSAEKYEDLVDDNDESPESASSKQIVKEYEKLKRQALKTAE